LLGDKFILKTFRRLEAGLNPDLEINRFLAEHNFPHVPPLAGGLTYRTSGGEDIGLGILSGFMANCKDGWEYTLEVLGRYYQRIGSLPEEQRTAPKIDGLPLDGITGEVPVLVTERLSSYVEAARLLGQRTAELHLCLASDKDNKDFAPEPFNPFYQRSLFQSMRNMAVQSLSVLRGKLKTVPESSRADAEKMGAFLSEILKRLRAVADGRLSGYRTRIHGDYHLGQLLQTGKDFLIIDFEGEPARSIGERRFKRTPLTDVAGMLRSFDYAAYAALFAQLERGVVTAESRAWVEPWARYWTHWASVIFLKAYFETARQGDFLPATPQEVKVLVDASLISKALYELRYELNNRPAWLPIPLRGLLQMLESAR
jgi:maltose alpha-D-glucosyltransferase/alpha-amylase